MGKVRTRTVLGRQKKAHILGPKIKLIDDFTDEFQLESAKRANYASGSSTKISNLLEELCQLLQEARVTEDALPICSSIRTLLTPSLECKIVLALPVLMPAVCPLLVSPAAALRQAAVVILFIIASKVRREVLLLPTLQLCDHLSSALVNPTSAPDTVHLLQQLLCAAPQLLRACSHLLAPPLLSLLALRCHSRNTLWKSLGCVFDEMSDSIAAGRWRTWLEDLERRNAENVKNLKHSSEKKRNEQHTTNDNSSDSKRNEQHTTNDNSSDSRSNNSISASEGSEAVNLSLLMTVIAELLQLRVLAKTAAESEDDDSTAAWARVTAVILSSDVPQPSLVSRSRLDRVKPNLKRLLCELRLLELLRLTLCTHSAQKAWLQQTIAPRLRRMHGALLPPGRAAPFSGLEAEELRLTLLAVCVHYGFYDCRSLQLLTRALADELPRLEDLPNASQELVSLYFELFASAYTWLRDDEFQRSCHLLDHECRCCEQLHNHTITHPHSETTQTAGTCEGKSGSSVLPVSHTSAAHLPGSSTSLLGTRQWEALPRGAAARADKLLADAMEEPLLRKSNSPWNNKNKTLTEAQLLEKLLRHDVQRFLCTDKLALIEPVLSNVMTGLGETKQRQAQDVEDWQARRQELARDLLEALGRSKALVSECACTRFFSSTFAWLVSLSPNELVRPSVHWVYSVLREAEMSSSGLSADVIAALERCSQSLALV